MIHYWECKICTSQWRTCCFGEMFESPEQRELNRRKPYHFCDHCFLELEKTDKPLLHVLHLKQRLEKKSEELRKVVDDLTAILGFGYEHHLKDLLRELGAKKIKSGEIPC